MSKYQKYAHILCNQLCEEMKCFEAKPTNETLKSIKDLTKAIKNLQEIEAGGAMRQIAENYGYDSDSARFDVWDDYDGMPPYVDDRRGRDSRGRYTSRRGGMRTGPYNMPYDDHWPDRRRDGRRGRYDDYDDEPYILRQENGKPIMTPYAAHDKNSIPKRLTKEQYEEWMHSLVNADGSSGPHFTMEQAKQVQDKHGMEHIDKMAFWAALNASYSDLCEFFKKHGINTIEAYADYTLDFWFEDEDAVGGGDGNAEKLSAYYSAVVEH